MVKPQLRQKQPTLRMVVEFTDQSCFVLPEDITFFCLRWLESMTCNGFSDVRIKSEKCNHEIIMTMEAGSIFQGKLASHRAEAIASALQRHRFHN